VLKPIYQNFSEIAISHLAQNADRYSYLVEDFLGMNARVLAYNAELILSSPVIGKLLDMVSSLFMRSINPRVLKAAYNFLNYLFMLFWD
jgi:hypothetical protein